MFFFNFVYNLTSHVPVVATQCLFYRYAVNPISGYMVTRNLQFLHSL